MKTKQKPSHRSLTQVTTMPKDDNSVDFILKNLDRLTNHELVQIYKAVNDRFLELKVFR